VKSLAYGQISNMILYVSVLKLPVKHAYIALGNAESLKILKSCSPVPSTHLSSGQHQELPKCNILEV